MHYLPASEHLRGYLGLQVGLNKAARRFDRGARCTGHRSIFDPSRHYMERTGCSQTPETRCYNVTRLFISIVALVGPMICTKQLAINYRLLKATLRTGFVPHAYYVAWWHGGMVA